MAVIKKLHLRESDSEEIRKTLLRVEPLGVLARELCYHSIPLDNEDSSKTVIPPRLFLIRDSYLLVHAYGDDAFYDLFPEYERGGLSAECYVLDAAPRALANYYAQEGLYIQAGVLKGGADALSLNERRPPPLTPAQQREWVRNRRREIRERDRNILGLTRVK